MHTKTLAAYGLAAIMIGGSAVGATAALTGGQPAAPDEIQIVQADDAEATPMVATSTPTTAGSPQDTTPGVLAVPSLEQDQTMPEVAYPEHEGDEHEDEEEEDDEDHENDEDDDRYEDDRGQ